MTRPAGDSCGVAKSLRARLALLLCLWLLPPFAGAAEIIATRVWPAREYTRVTLESKAPIRFEVSTVANPARLVLDLEGIALTKNLNDLVAKIQPMDPFVSQVRVGRYRPGTTRVVFDLKQEVRSRAFVIEPVGEYRHRLVVDLYPQADVVARLIEELNQDDGDTLSPAAQAPGAAASKGSAQRKFLIAIDAGHGGEDPGATGRHGTLEKDITLAIAREVKRQVDESDHMRAVLIRDGDYFIPLGERVNRARLLRADLFVSIHADAFDNPRARGSSVFALSEKGATSAAARWLAKRENAADLIGGIDLSVADVKVKQVLFDLSQTATLNDSLKLARAVLKQIGTVNTLHKPQVEQAGFAVLKAPDIPSILVETAFITNGDEEKKLRTEAYRKKLARAISAGLWRHLATVSSPDKTAGASESLRRKL